MQNNATRDRLQRPLRDLRLSVTDRCNLRCTYCMPADRFHDEYDFLPRADLLSFEELTRASRLAVALGVEKIRITGGEPLMRRNLPKLVVKLAEESGVGDLALTTNGVLLERQARELRAAGLTRVTVSLDSLREDTFRGINGGRASVREVLDGIAAAQEAGFRSIKVNCVVQRGVNEDDIAPLAEHFRHSGIVLRFIEFMDVGSMNQWKLDKVVSAEEVLARITARHALEKLPARYPGEVAERYRYADGGGEIGIIASVTQPFCGGCNRLRLSANGALYTCLFATKGTDLRIPMRQGASDADLVALIREIWKSREDQYSMQREAVAPQTDRVQMYHIGG